MKYEAILIKPNGTEEVLHRNLTEHQAIGMAGTNTNIYYREQKRRVRFITWCRKDPEDETPINYTFKTTENDGTRKTLFFTSEDTVSFSMLSRVRNAWIEKIEYVNNEFQTAWNVILYED